MKLHVGYGVAAVGYMIGIFFLSSGHVESSSGAAPHGFSSLLYIPLFGGLVACLLLALSDGRWSRTISWPLYALVGLMATTYAALDEWHQALIAGGRPSLRDFLLTCLSITAFLALHRLGSRVLTRASDKGRGV